MTTSLIWQYALVGGLVLLATGALVRRLWRRSSAACGSGCGSCSSCGSGQGEQGVQAIHIQATKHP
ncbi:FeoB-associated Cys-rich membrane protein [Pseudomonas oryzihabitans]|uniref:FeoB-associated Cys-rich membrane protein n=1 Tax=Pseudomonas oryzihabitans TaxID=47885 RepID=UPI0034611082